jgi:hypothetical protein
MNRRVLLLMICLITLLPGAMTAAGTVRRFVLAAGANFGGHDRIELRYAVSDAERFADVMQKMGGVDAADYYLLSEPDLDVFESTLSDLGKRVSAAKDSTGRTEVLLYYSGHADENGLLLGEERLAYSILREQMDSIDADVRITVLDACASGAITRIKGGQRRQAFLVDDSSDMQGYAFLTSSSATEAAPESDRIGASFFTHYLVSGMRGAADMSGEGKVTLNEAYQFAFHETLAKTTETEGGAQHPAYHINLSGTGDVVMTDVRETSAGLMLTEDLDGRFFVRNADEQLVAELYKPAGRTVELGLEPGSYEIILEKKELLMLASTELESGDRIILEPSQFEPGDRELTVLRGTPAQFDQTGPPPVSLSGRSRFELGFGWWSAGPDAHYTDGDLVSSHVENWDVIVNIGYARWLREDLAVGLTLTALGGEVVTGIGTEVYTESMGLASIMVNGRKYFPKSTLQSEMRPYFTLGIGTLIGSVTKNQIGPGVDTTVGTMGAIGGQFGAGIDMQVTRFFMLDTRVAYNLVSDFKEPFAGRTNYSGFEFMVGFNFLWGKGHYPVS